MIRNDLQMGKLKKLKSGVGDLISKPLPLDLQIERSKRESGRNTARVKQRKLKRERPDDEVRTFHKYSYIL